MALVVPCYNAGASVRLVVERALAFVEHVFVVDDGSTDRGVEQLGDLPVRVITFSENRGKGAALLAGFRAALDIPGIACVAVIDADGQHDPAEIPVLYEAYVTNRADLVIGSRTFDEADVPWRSWFGNRATVTVVAWLLKQRLPDTQSGFRLHSRRLIEDVLETVPAGRYETEMAILTTAIRRRYVVRPVRIKTIYEKGNPSSHFKPLRDSWRVYRTLFLTALRLRNIHLDT